jgi:MFS family permease
MNLVLAKRWNLEIGIPDMVMLIFTDAVFNVIITIMYVLPILALFAKITPRKIEGTIYAFLTGTWNLSWTIIATLWGTFINHHFVGVNKNDQSGYSTLVLIALIGSILTFALLPLIPMKKQIRRW